MIFILRASRLGPPLKVPVDTLPVDLKKDAWRAMHPDLIKQFDTEFL
jgi:hypothetical protein